MPLFLLLAAGAGVFWVTADATEGAADALSKLAWAGAAAGGVYLAGRVLKAW